MYPAPCMSDRNSQQSYLAKKKNQGRIGHGIKDEGLQKGNGKFKCLSSVCQIRVRYFVIKCESCLVFFI